MRLPELVLHGSGAADLRQALTDGHVERSFSGSATLQLSVRDPDRRLLRSQLLAGAAQATVDPVDFELAAVRKSGSQLTLTFEDTAVARLRSRKGLLVAKAGTVTRGGFAKRLLDDADVDSLVAPGARTRVQLSRGSDDDREEDSWTALRRLADDVDWRCFSLGRIVVFAPDDWLFAGHTVRPGGAEPLNIREHAGGVGDIDFDADAGKPAQSASLQATVGRRWRLAPGTPVQLSDLGRGDGRWLVESVNQPLFSSRARVQLTRHQPAQSEPIAEAA